MLSRKRDTSAPVSSLLFSSPRMACNGISWSTVCLPPRWMRSRLMFCRSQEDCFRAPACPTSYLSTLHSRGLVVLSQVGFLRDPSAEEVIEAPRGRSSNAKAIATASKGRKRQAVQVHEGIGRGKGHVAYVYIEGGATRLVSCCV